MLAVPLLIRGLLLWQGSQNWLGRRIEISTPVNQWMRSRSNNSIQCTPHSFYTIPTVKEGIALVENGLSPYAGDIFHEVSHLYSLLKTTHSIMVIVDPSGADAIPVPVGSR